MSGIHWKTVGKRSDKKGAKHRFEVNYFRSQGSCRAGMENNLSTVYSNVLQAGFQYSTQFPVIYLVVGQYNWNHILPSVLSQFLLFSYVLKLYRSLPLPFRHPHLPLSAHTSQNCNILYTLLQYMPNINHGEWTEMLDITLTWNGKYFQIFMCCLRCRRSRGTLQYFSCIWCQWGFTSSATMKEDGAQTVCSNSAVL